MPNVLILVTGSVAALKLPLLIEQLLELPSSNQGKINIRVVVTEASLHFFSLEKVQEMLGDPKAVLRDADEWAAWRSIGDPVLHIDLRNWADIGVIAPLDANTLGKIASGMCDNLLTCVLRAWDASKPLLYAPAMNVHMWEHPLTRGSLETLSGYLGYIQIGPISKRLACGDLGMGAMAEVDQIAEAVALHLAKIK